jgi:DNA-binding HxlR family transcriptional regulator
MTGDDRKKKCGAAFIAAMEVLAKPWNGRLMFELEGGPLRFSELGDRVPDIGDRMLAARLKELESRGLLARKVEPGPPVRVLYELTSIGRGYRPVGEAIERWGRMFAGAEESPSGKARMKKREAV